MPERTPSRRAPRARSAKSLATDQNGQYEFDGLEAGRYRLQVHKSGFAPLNGPRLPEIAVEAGARCEPGSPVQPLAARERPLADSHRSVWSAGGSAVA